jgi:hypothetical protein
MSEINWRHQKKAQHERGDRLIELERRTADRERDKWTVNISSILILCQGSNSVFPIYVGYVSRDSSVGIATGLWSWMP